MPFFKSIMSRSLDNIGDAYWNSSDGKISILIDAVQCSPNPALTKKTILEFLYQYEEKILLLNSEDIIHQINAYLILQGNRDLLAVVIIAEKKVDTIELSWVGNPRCYFIKDGNFETLIEPWREPSEVVGSQNILNVLSKELDLVQEGYYIICTDGINILSETSLPKDIAQMSDNDWLEWGTSNKCESDWCMSVFPFERLMTYQDEEWPYFPFIGVQEEREHEKSGLSAIATELFNDSDFDGFKIIGSVIVPRINSIRKLDGILVSPYGLTILELKDHWGDITLSIVNRGQMKVAKEDGTFLSEASPYFKLDEIITPFSEQEILKTVLPFTEQKRLGAVVFTNLKASVKILSTQGEAIMPMREGNIIITSPKDLAMEIKTYAKKTLGKSSRITQETIDKVCDILKGDTEVTNFTEMKIRGRYIFNPSNIIESESSDYYKMYLGHDVRKNKPVWIKNYMLSTISRESLDDEAIRIGREAEALREFDGYDQVQKYIDTERIDEQYYLILECVEGNNIDLWLDLKPSVMNKFDILLSIATIMKEIEIKGIPHRAINNKNLRIASTGEVKLINFELCKYDYLPTLPPSARRELDTKFQSREVRSAVSQNITTAADMYSFATLICYVLSNEIVITSDEYIQIIRNKKKREGIAHKCNISLEDFEELLPAFDINPSGRLNACQLYNILLKWKETYGN